MTMFTSKLMSAFFTTSSGAPATGLSTTIDIWRVSDNTQVVTGDPMTEVGGGFYKYDFTSYDYTELYAVRFDGTVTLGSRRYTPAWNTSFYQDTAFGNWEETASDHTTADTTGGLLNLIAAVLVNRTRIDTASSTLTIYDADCTTPLIVFDLKDQTGNPSVIEVCERRPTTCP